MNNDTENTASSGFSLTAKGLIRSLSLSSQTVPIIQGVDLQLSAGETCAIIGASGSGKTTLLGMLAAMDVPNSGSVEIADEDISYSIYQHDEDWRAWLRGSAMGFVFQDFQLVDDMTALDNVLLPLELAGKRLPELGRDWLKRVGLGDRMNHYPRQLSGGEQQRVALARAFANHPRILFADEPTGSLDESTGKAMIELLFELNTASGSTLVMVTHDPVLAQRCDKVYLLKQGRLEPSLEAL